jgi:hypothetical protein
MSWPNVKYFLVKCIKSTTRYWEVLIGIANACSLAAYWNTRIWLDCHLVSWVHLVVYTPLNLYLFTYLLVKETQCSLNIPFYILFSLLFATLLTSDYVIMYCYITGTVDLAIPLQLPTIMPSLLPSFHRLCGRIPWRQQHKSSKIQIEWISMV